MVNRKMSKIEKNSNRVRNLSLSSYNPIEDTSKSFTYSSTIHGVLIALWSSLLYAINLFLAYKLSGPVSSPILPLTVKGSLTSMKYIFIDLIEIILLLSGVIFIIEYFTFGVIYE